MKDVGEATYILGVKNFRDYSKKLQTYYKSLTLRKSLKGSTWLIVSKMIP